MAAFAGRYAPSPTGPLHLGNLRIALLAWLFARSAGARFLVRVEDLDRSRSRAHFERAQLQDLEAIGLDWDGEVVRQSERQTLYAAAIARLDAAGLLYPCYCTRAEIREAASAPHGPFPEGAYPGTCRRLSALARREREATSRPPALRLDAGAVTVGFTDRVQGDYEGVVDDLVVRRNDGARLAKRHGAVTLDDRRALGESGADVRAGLLRSVGLPGELDEARAAFDPAALPTEPTVLAHEANAVGGLASPSCDSERSELRR